MFGNSIFLPTIEFTKELWLFGITWIAAIVTQRGLSAFASKWECVTIHRHRGTMKGPAKRLGEDQFFSRSEF